jgi:hypothetical protein
VPKPKSMRGDQWQKLSQGDQWQKLSRGDQWHGSLEGAVG